MTVETARITVIKDKNAVEKKLKEISKGSPSQGNALYGLAKVKKNYFQCFQNDSKKEKQEASAKVKALDNLKKYRVFTYGGRSFKVLTTLLNEVNTIKAITAIIYKLSKNKEINEINKDICLYFEKSDNKDLIVLEDKEYKVVMVSTTVINNVIEELLTK